MTYLNLRRLIAVLAGIHWSLVFTAILPATARATEPAAGVSQKLLVAHKWGDSVGFYDASSGALEQTVPVGRRPHELALSLDGRRAYATLYGIDLFTETVEGGRSVAVVDVEHRKKLGEIDLGKYRRPHGIEIGHASGLLYVTCDHPAALVVIDPTQSKVAAAVELSNPKSLCHMVTLSRDERTAFVANCGTADVSAIDLAQHKEVARISVGGIPMGMALSADGHTLFATTRTANALAVIDVRERKVARLIEITGQPVRALLTPDGKHVLTTLIDSGELAVVDAEKWTLERRLPVGKRVEGLAVDPAGRFAYCAAQADDKVVKFSLTDWRQVSEIKAGPRPDPILVLPR